MPRIRTRLTVKNLEARDVPSGNRLFAIGDNGGLLSVFEATGPLVTNGAPASPMGPTGTGRLALAFEPFPGFRGGVRVALGDVTADGVEDVVVGAGAGGGPHVKVYDGAAALTGQAKLVTEFFAFDERFRGGVFVATGQVNPLTLTEEIVVSAGGGGGSHIRVFEMSIVAPPLIHSVPPQPSNPGELTFQANQQTEFFAFDAGFRGGARVAVGDINGDGRGDVIAAAGPGGGPHVRAFDVYPNDPLVLRLSGHGLLDELFAYDASFRGGVYVAAGEFDGSTATAEIATTPGEGGGPHLKVYSRVGNRLGVTAEAYFGAANANFGYRVGFANLAQLSNRQSIYVGVAADLLYNADVTAYDKRLNAFTLTNGRLDITPVIIPNGGTLGVYVGV